MSWTDERIEDLKQLWHNGLTASQIAEKLGAGLSRNAIIGKAHRLGLQARPSPVKAGEPAPAPVAAAVPEPAAPVPAPSPPMVVAVETPQPVAPDPPRRILPSHGPVPPSGEPAPKKRAVALRASAAIAGKTSLLDLSDKVCKWPIGHPGEADFHFCGKPSQASFPYCGDHCLLAYQAQMPRRDRPGRPMPQIPGFRPR